MKSREIDFGKTYSSTNYGDFKIIAEAERKPSKKKRVLIEFTETGTRAKVSYDEALKGCVKDVMRPSIFGVAYLGNAHKKGNERLYNLWINMLSRCYNPRNKAYRFYGEKGCYVDDRWLCFENFLSDVKEISGSELLKTEKKIELDKDIMQRGMAENKCYSKDTCVWVSKDSNNRVHLVDSNKKNDYSSKYVGVCFDKRWGVFQAQINIDGKQVYIGKFTNEIAAANAYNYYAEQQGIEITKNDCEFMGKEEWESFRTKRGKKNSRPSTM